MKVYVPPGPVCEFGIELRDGAFHSCNISSHATENFGRLMYGHEFVAAGMDCGEFSDELKPGILVATAPLREAVAQQIAQAMNAAMNGVPGFALSPDDFRRAHKAMLQELHRQADEISAESKLWCAQFASKTGTSPAPHA